MSSYLSSNVIIAVPVEKVGSEYYLALNYVNAPLFAIVEVSANTYKIRNIIGNPYAAPGPRRGLGVIEFLASQGVNAIILLRSSYGAFYRLGERGIKVYYVPVEEQSKGPVKLSEAIEMYVSRRLEGPTQY
uniref:Dinitrogenase iron-molybdenum cofactor biosynthesis domain-containing protein n=1 Tax=Thermogladius calderae TaxID=1200300 RepID=A0A7J3Y0G5_9CREN